MSICVLAAALAPWQDPSVNSINRLPARELLVPCETEDMAIKVARGDVPASASKWVISLNGEWDFKWKREPSRDWEKSAKIKVPGCWQMQGDFDPPLYSNSLYPLAFDGSGDPMKEPPKEFTSYSMRNPVGLYTTTFKCEETFFHCILTHRLNSSRTTEYKFSSKSKFFNNLTSRYTWCQYTCDVIGLRFIVRRHRERESKSIIDTHIIIRSISIHPRQT